MERTPLDETEIAEKLAALNGWSLESEGKAIVRDFKFANFRRAFAFMTECAMSAEKLDHHPEWSNVYSKVSIRLTTHSANGLTDLDFRLAGAIDAAASSYD